MAGPTERGLRNKNKTEHGDEKKRCLAAAFGPAQGEEKPQQRGNGKASIYVLVAAFGQAQGGMGARTETRGKDGRRKTAGKDEVRRKEACS